jgi:arylsulfatase A-like enzyme
MLSAAAAAPLALAQSRGRRMNVLFIAVDDLRPSFGCYGDTLAKTPHMDALAARGLTFTRSYCQQAVCSPSRTSLLTGLRPDTTRVYELQTHFRKNVPDAITLPEQFRRNGYVTTGLSKIYHPGLDDFRSWSIPSWAPGPRLAWNTPENAALQERRWNELHAGGLRHQAPVVGRAERGPSWRAPEVADNELPDGRTADTAIAALNTLKDQPFFLAVGFLKPHLPFVAPKRYFDLYRDTTFIPAANPFPPKDAPPQALTNFGELRTYADIDPTGPVPEAKALELIRAYYASMSYADAQIGRVISELDRLNLRRNTIVILWGDHGYHLGDHGLWNKHTNFENATRAPLLISVPGQKHAGRRTSALTEFVDIYPSLCELCGVSVPDTLEGTSFRPLLENPDRRWKKAAFSQYPRAKGVMGHSMRTERYRFTEWKGPDVHALELYDHERDPGENVNVASLAENAKLVEQLTAQLHAGWRAARP